MEIVIGLVVFVAFVAVVVWRSKKGSSTGGSGDKPSDQHYMDER